jgi:2-polyprenyl-6-methoxyphenol hydroxylase-like FAD-dependent oxidoreductase
VIAPQVVIVGAGPVGLTLAIDLGKRNIRCLLVEQKAQPQFLPKMERCNARTMEMFRRIGIADTIRAGGLPSDIPMDVYFIRSLTKPPLLRLQYPSVDQARSQIERVNDGSAPLEPYQLISQYSLEPLLRQIAEAHPTVEIRYSTEFVEFSANEQGVVVRVRNTSGATESYEAEYLVGCDGGGSPVRRQLGIRLRGEGNVGKLRQGLFRCDDLFGRLPMGEGPGRGRHYLLATDRPVFMIMQSSTRHWTVHAAVDNDAQMRRQFEQIVGTPVDYEMLYCEEWRQNLLLADRYQVGRVFLAGDAVHLVIPAGGLGMNSGVGDAFDLSWKLAATLEGWAGPELLGSYEIERRQVGERVVGASRYASAGYRKWLSHYSAAINAETAEGASARTQLAAIIDIEGRKALEMIGAELGYRYLDSPVIDHVPGGPEQTFRSYQPTAWPGARLPHVWLSDQRPLHDLIPNHGFTLLRLGGKADTDLLVDAFLKQRVPLTVLDVNDRQALKLYERSYLLVRPDLHVVWRGDTPPADADELVAIAAGFGSRTTGARGLTSHAR